MKRALLWALGAVAGLAVLLTGLSYGIYGRSPQATAYEMMLRRRFATGRTAEEETARLEKRRGKAEPACALPEDVTFRAPIREKTWQGLKVFALNWERRDTTVLYLHGGAYINSFNAYQWRVMDDLAANADCCVLAPAYHLAPYADFTRAYADLTALCRAFAEANPDSRLILMGDSAGGGLALGLAQALAQAGEALPERLILLSPWVDVSMDNPDIAGYVAADPILHLELTRVHGRFWAGDADTHDPRVSPLYGEMAGLPPVTVYCGTRELLYPDILLACEKMAAAGVAVDLHVGRGLNHDYPLMPIPEGRAAAREVVELVGKRAVAEG